MLEITIHDGRGGHREVYDLHNLPLPDGTLAHHLPQSDLYDALAAIGVPGIQVSNGHQQLLIAYARHLRATTPDPKTGKLPHEEKVS
jgi:hypothetical protein